MTGWKRAGIRALEFTAGLAFIAAVGLLSLLLGLWTLVVAPVVAVPPMLWRLRGRWK